MLLLKYMNYEYIRTMSFLTQKTAVPHKNKGRREGQIWGLFRPSKLNFPQKLFKERQKYKRLICYLVLIRVNIWSLILCYKKNTSHERVKVSRVHASTFSGLKLYGVSGTLWFARRVSHLALRHPITKTVYHVFITTWLKEWMYLVCIYFSGSGQISPLPLGRSRVNVWASKFRGQPALREWRWNISGRSTDLSSIIIWAKVIFMRT